MKLQAVMTIAVLSLAPLTGSAGSDWAVARAMPGMGAQSALVTVACGQSGNCSAGGYLTSKSGVVEAAIANEALGNWHAARPVPGIVALNQGGYAEVLSISCSSVENCSAGGFYASSRFGGFSDTKLVAFGVTETNGTWGPAQAIPGLAALTQGNVAGAALTSISCTSPGNCSAGGYFKPPSAPGCCRYRSFAVSEVAGTWDTAVVLHGPAAMQTGGFSGGGVTAISCSSPGNCTAGGFYGDPADTRHPYVVSQVNGTWGTALREPGSSFTSGSAVITTVSCASAGNCTAGGYNTEGNGPNSFVISQTSGTWGKARTIPGAAALIKGGASQVTGVSCPAVGNCLIGGFGFRTIEVGSSTRDFAVPFVASLRNGNPGPATQIPGINAFSKDGYAEITALACAAPGDCAVGGTFSTSSYNPDGSGPGQAFAASEVQGTWRRAKPLTSKLNPGGGAQLAAIACPQPLMCAAVGYFGEGTDISSQQLAFFANQYP